MRTERANAKINLYLDIVSRRENGYHDLYTIMQTVSLCDLVSVDFRPGIHTEIHLQASGNDKMPLDCRNLAWRAAEAFLQAADRRGVVTIMIEKHIPMEAGLAGGSTDAAAVLRALNHLCGSPLSFEKLCEIGAKLGADVPFCIAGGCAVAEGIGERLNKQKGLSKCALVVACMGDGVSTPQAYGSLDEMFDGFAQARSTERGKALAEILCSEAEINSFATSFYNIFEEVVPPVRPCVDRVKEIMKRSGAVTAMMSGSGPSVFGVFETAEQAAIATEALKREGAVAFVCHPTNAYETTR